MKLAELGKNSAGQNEAHEALYGVNLLLQRLIADLDPELEFALLKVRDLICDRMGIV